MAKPGATPMQRPPAGTEPATIVRPSPDANGVEGDNALVAMFNRIRDELVSTLVYLLGNADDAQDAAQEAFLKCWRVRHTLGDVQNLRAWIFRVGMNTARDVQRSAWSRKSRPLPEDELMMPGIVDDRPAGRSKIRKHSTGSGWRSPNCARRRRRSFSSGRTAN